MRSPNDNNGIITSRGFSGCVPLRFVSSIADLGAGWKYTIRAEILSRRSGMERRKVAKKLRRSNPVVRK